MKVLRRQEIETNSILVGDKILIELAEFGDFTATAQKITEAGILFLFDECVAVRQMNEKGTNKGGYEKSSLCKWINGELLQAFPEELKSRISELTIPTYGQIFGHDEWYERAIEPDEDEQLPLMEIRKSRIADFKNEYEWYWLKNATKRDYSAACFARVDRDGFPAYTYASTSVGVRPVFLLS